jgi:hypothetical protein
MRTYRTTSAIAMALFLASTSWAASGQEDYLSLSGDGSVVEKAIESYLNRNGMKATTVAGNNGAIHFVMVGYLTQSGGPGIVYKITALPPMPNGAGSQLQQILITLETNVKVEHESDSLYGAISAANQNGDCSWFVDSSQLKCRTWVRIPGQDYPVPAELIRSAIRFINGDWLKFSPQVTAALK